MPNALSCPSLSATFPVSNAPINPNFKSPYNISMHVSSTN